MSSSLSLSKNYALSNKELCCPICFEKYYYVYNKPVIFDCGHSICDSCSKTIHDNCPTCLQKNKNTKINHELLIHIFGNEVKDFMVNTYYCVGLTSFMWCIVDVILHAGE